MRIPTRKEAIQFLEEGGRMNPGKWVSHSIYTAEAAEAIAKEHPGMDPEVAYILGALHDIGRRAGIQYMHHVMDGYCFLKEKGYDDAARICLTHSFKNYDISEYSGACDCTEEEVAFLKDYLASIEYSDYDRLVQLCDYLALPTGFCLIEKRMVDVALRYGTNEYTIKTWRTVFEIKDKFEQAIGKSIYGLLPGIVENTFEFEKGKY